MSEDNGVCLELKLTHQTEQGHFESYECRHAISGKGVNWRRPNNKFKPVYLALYCS